MEKEIKTVDFKLYLITDRNLLTPHSSLLTAVEEALKGGVKAVQLREKDLRTRDLLEMAYKMREMTKKYNAKFFVNDRVDVALAVGADGVHLGQQSIPAEAVRRIAHNKLMVGASTHSIEEAISADKQGADFITLGPVFETPSKMKYGKPVGVDLLREAKEKISIPVFAIGGIKEDKVSDVIKAGADGIALVSGIFGASQIKEKTDGFMRLLK